MWGSSVKIKWEYYFLYMANVPLPKSCPETKLRFRVHNNNNNNGEGSFRRNVLAGQGSLPPCGRCDNNEAKFAFAFAGELEKCRQQAPLNSVGPRCGGRGRGTVGQQHGVATCRQSRVSSPFLFSIFYVRN